MKSLQKFIYESEETSKPINAFIILKPEFLEYQQEWLDKIMDSGWTVKEMIELTLSPNQAKRLYKMHCDEDWFKDLCDYMASGPCVCAICHKDCKKPIKDMKQIKYYFRDKYGKDEMKNMMHSSDSLKNVEREKNIIFK